MRRADGDGVVPTARDAGSTDALRPRPLRPRRTHRGRSTSSWSGRRSRPAPVRRHGAPGHRHRAPPAALRPARHGAPERTQRSADASASARSRTGCRRAPRTGTSTARSTAASSTTRRRSGAGHVTVVTLKPGSLEHDPEVAVTGAGSDVYSSTDRLYVTRTEGFPQAMRERTPRTGWSGRRAASAPRSTRSPSTAAPPATSPPAPSPAPSATAGPSTSRTVTCGSRSPGPTRRSARAPAAGQRHRRARRAGRTARAGRAAPRPRRRREIQSVRWFGDLAVVVTFRQMDPLYTVDLSDPTPPARARVRCTSPGFSTYLHPIGNGQLLGLGMDVDRAPARAARPASSTSPTRRRPARPTRSPSGATPGSPPRTTRTRSPACPDRARGGHGAPATGPARGARRRDAPGSASVRRGLDRARCPRPAAGGSGAPRCRRRPGRALPGRASWTSAGRCRRPVPALSRDVFSGPCAATSGPSTTSSRPPPRTRCTPQPCSTSGRSAAPRTPRRPTRRPSTRPSPR